MFQFQLLAILQVATVWYLDTAAEYLASFKVAQLCLKVGDRVLGMLESAVGSSGKTGKLRRAARALRRAGARRAGVSR
jgi:hypothetical protein